MSCMTVWISMKRPLAVQLSILSGNSGLKRLIDAGVTTVRDTGGADLGLKQAIDDGLVAGPRLHLSISMLSSTAVMRI
jgi:imidazolonepropionase-like amidohydrolase